MEKQLELKHLAAYLPYGLRINCQNIMMFGISNDYAVMINENNQVNATHFSQIKPILRPLSDLTKEIEIDGEKFVPIQFIRNEFEKIDGNHRDFDFPLTLDGYLCGIFSLPYWVIETLCKNHFDIFNLIDSKLAIDINTLNTTENGSKILQPQI